MSLWTVTITRLQLVSKWDAHGKKISDTVEKIPVTICDLPYITAKMYFDKGAPGEVSMTQQISAFETWKAKPGQFASSGERRRVETMQRNYAKTARKIAPKPDTTVEAAKSADFAAAITAETGS